MQPTADGNQQYDNDAETVMNHIVGEYNPTGSPATPLGFQL
jgi:hypothetical protein